MNERRHLSVSQLNMYARCPAQYERVYALGERRPPGIAAHVGLGVHDGAKEAMTFKAKTESNRSAEDIMDVAVAGFDSRVQKEDVDLNPEEQTINKQVLIGAARDRVAFLSHFWACTAQLDYQPASVDSVEHRFSIPITSLEIDFVGVVDLLDNHGRVVDWKVSRRSLQDDADKGIQLTAYALWHRKETGEDPSEVRLDVIKNTAETKRQVLVGHRTTADYQSLLTRIATTKRAIDAGIFPPCDPTSWNCDQKWCGFYSTCPYVQH